MRNVCVDFYCVSINNSNNNRNNKNNSNSNNARLSHVCDIFVHFRLDLEFFPIN